ncbi:hypothetical protein HRR83_000623 [Exophiala dermatitidis]|nr:hypothetical protein HRR74_000626 [Exophiala dermatitidis]KAJ4528505.1 hypothetical protein HRR73_001128 [Exophiala dermatitidis]KAJ4529875.1 hypothetical protein HRR76_009124 [Exophiala dermatitidis]KAJ4558635.1 hypothetical protein HRR77_000623 [Exophiala dermatitidis]KAJ4581333.1 hypothetical protein HRR79_000374 [Exophiala dermatitidis]
MVRPPPPKPPRATQPLEEGLINHGRGNGECISKHHWGSAGVGEVASPDRRPQCQRSDLPSGDSPCEVSNGMLIALAVLDVVVDSKPAAQVWEDCRQPEQVTAHECYGVLVQSRADGQG